MKQTQNIPLKYGSIMSAITATCLLLMEVTGQNQSFDSKSPIFAFGMFIAPAIVWYFGLKEKKEQQKGKLTFKEGVTEGFKISLAFGLISPFVFTAYYLFINPPILEYVREAYQLGTASNAVVIGVDMTVQLLSAIVFGTIYAAIISFFMKSKSK